MYLKHRVYIVIICVMFAVGPGYSKSIFDSFNDLLSFKISDDIFSSVNEGIVGNLSAKNIKFIAPNSIEMDDVKVLDDHGDLVLFGKHVRLRISLLSLLTKNIRITDAYVDSPFFHYKIVGGVHNVLSPFVPRTKSPTEKPSKFRVTIEKVRVENGSYRMYHDVGLEIYAAGIVANGRFWVEKGPFGVDIDQVNIATGSIATGGMNLPISKLVANNLFISHEKVSTDKLTALYEQSPLTGRGTVYIKEDRYDVEASLDAKKDSYPRGLKPLPFTAPAFRAFVTMTGRLTEPELTTHLVHDEIDFRGLKIKKGNASGIVSAHEIIVNSANLFVDNNGTISARGNVNLDRSNFYFKSEQKNILVEHLAQFFSLQEKVDGVVDAKTELSGEFKNDSHIAIKTAGTIAHGAINRLHLQDETHFDVAANFVIDKELRITRANFDDKHGLHLHAHGHGDLANQAMTFAFDISCPEVNNYVSLESSADSIRNLKAKGNLSFKNHELEITSSVSAASVTRSKIDAQELKVEVELKKNRLSLHELTARAYDGKLSFDIIVDDITRKNILTGSGFIETIDIGLLRKPFTDLALGGKLSGSATIAGSLDAPDLRFVSEIDGLSFDNAVVKSVQAVGSLVNNRIEISELTALSGSGALVSNKLSLDLSSQKIDGHVDVESLNLSSLLANYRKDLVGIVNGRIQVDGTLSSPSLLAPLSIRKLSAFGLQFGQGAFTLALARRPLLGDQASEDLVFSLSANLVEQQSTMMARFAVGLTKKTVNTEIVFDGLLVNTRAMGLIDKYIGLRGHFGGIFTAEGLLMAPTLTANITAKDYHFFNPVVENDELTAKARGPLLITANAKKGKLNLDVCASFLDPAVNRLCGDEAAFRMSMWGPVGLDGFALNYLGSVDYNHLENIVLPLKNEIISFDSKARFDGKITKVKNKELSYQTNLAVDRLFLSLPNVPSISLREPLSLVITDGAVDINDNATFLFSPGQLTVSGSIAKPAVDLHLEGSIPLVLARIFAPIVQRANGLMTGNVTLSGSIDECLVEGSLAPERGASITLRRWLEPIEIRDGRIEFNKSSATAFSTKFDQIKLAVGDGKLAIDGSLTKDYGSKLRPSSTQFDLDLQGSNIVIRDRLDFVEADFKIRTVQSSEHGSVMEGDVIVTDGGAHRQFDLRNFVAEARSGIKGDVFKSLEDVDMNLMIDIAVRQFKATARMLNFDIEANLRGQMTVEGPVSHPKFKGALSLNEGAIAFPATSFDLIETQIVLDETSSKVFDPKIDIVATQELDLESYGEYITQDTTVELSLKGDMDHLNLGFKPIRGDLRLSQLRIFLLLVSPRSFAGLNSDDQFEVLKRGAQRAAMAISGEVFLRPLTNELQELLEGQTKTRFQFGSVLEPGGVSLRLNWKLGPRIELIGSYLFLSEEARKNERTGFMAENYPLGDLKLKLMLFDHRPAGPLFFESSFGSTRQIDDRYEPRGKVRLKYRVLAK